MARHTSRAFSLLASAFSPLCGMRHGIHFETPEDDSGGTGGGTAIATPPVTPAPPAAPTPAQLADIDNAVRERKRAKAANRAMLTALGFNPADIEIKGGGDSPFRFIVKATGEDLTPKLQQAGAFLATAGTGGTPRRNAGSADAVALATANAERESLKRRNAALIAYIKRVAVIEPIRAACVRHHAVDDDNGQFSDIIGQLAPLFVVDVQFDDDNESAEPHVSVTAMNGTMPLIDAKSSAPHTPDTIVAELLAKRPKYQQAKFRGGSGGNGSTVGGGISASSLITSPANDQQNDRQAQAVADMFGIRRTAIRTD